MKDCPITVYCKINIFKAPHASKLQISKSKEFKVLYGVIQSESGGNPGIPTNAENPWLLNSALLIPVNKKQVLIVTHVSDTQIRDQSPR
jgi:hypothetical protein